MTGLLLAAAALVAAAAVGLRRWRRAGLRRAALSMPGATAESAIYIRSFGEMDEHIGRRWCHCGGLLEPTGEGSREAGGRRFRIARLRCQECEELTELFFDTTDLLQ